MRKVFFKDEYRIFKKSTAIFLTPELYKFYKKTPFKIFSNKFTSIPFANINQLEVNQTDISKNFFDSKKINCLFAGRLYKSIRNPQKVIEVFSKLNKNIHLTLISNINKKMLINSFCTNSSWGYLDKISFFPIQNRDVALSLTGTADILINIGNNVEFQIPAKIFEYMSTGKPIIHFSKIKDDPTIFYLNKYPLTFIVKEWERIDEKTIKDIEQFCINNKNKKLKYEEVYKSLIDFSSNKVANDFNKKIKDLLKD